MDILTQSILVCDRLSALIGDDMPKIESWHNSACHKKPSGTPESTVTREIRIRVLNYLTAFLRFAVMCALVASFVPASAAEAETERSPAYNLAFIDNGRVDDLLEARFQSLLNQLSGTYNSDQGEIADQTVKCQELLQKDGISESLLNIMEGMNQIFDTANHNQKYSQWLAAYIVERDKGVSHDKAISGLNSLAASLGAP
jgi:hypothetical protein